MSKPYDKSLVDIVARDIYNKSYAPRLEKIKSSNDDEAIKLLSRLYRQGFYKGYDEGVTVCNDYNSDR